MKQILTIVFLFITLFSFAEWDGIPDIPNPPRLVIDSSGILTKQEVAQLEAKLKAFNDSTSNQIVIAIFPDLHGYDIADFTDRLGRKWQVGQSKLNNGVVIVLNVIKDMPGGKVRISVGYGLEGAIPDATASLIIEKEMKPDFKKGHMFAGLDKATTVLMALAAKEYTYANYTTKKKTEGKIGILVVFLVMFIVFMLMKFASRKQYTAGGKNGSSLPFWASLMMMSSMNNSQSSNFNSFSSGTGSFGGFGGGGFGGGGAGGSW